MTTSKFYVTITDMYLDDICENKEPFESEVEARELFDCLQVLGSGTIELTEYTYDENGKYLGCKIIDRKE